MVAKGCLPLAHKPRDKAVGPSKGKPYIAAGFAGSFLHSSLVMLCTSRSTHTVLENIALQVSHREEAVTEPVHMMQMQAEAYPHALQDCCSVLGAGLVGSALPSAPLYTPIAHDCLPLFRNGFFCEAASGPLMDGPAPFAVKGQHQVVKGNKGRAVADGDAGAPQLLHLTAEPLLHVHLVNRNALLLCYKLDSENLGPRVSTQQEAGEGPCAREKIADDTTRASSTNHRQ